MDIKLKDVARPGYPLGSNMDGAKKLIEAYIAAFNKLRYSPDTEINLWCRGSSGAILAGMFALKCKNECTICHIKKEGENSHKSNPEYEKKAINIVIDDFVDTGSTLEAIVQYIRDLEKWDDETDRLVPADLKFHVLMILDWEDAPETTTDKFTHKIGTRR